MRNVYGWSLQEKGMVWNVHSFGWGGDVRSSMSAQGGGHTKRVGVSDLNAHSTVQAPAPNLTTWRRNFGFISVEQEAMESCCPCYLQTIMQPNSLQSPVETTSHHPREHMLQGKFFQNIFYPHSAPDWDSSKHGFMQPCLLFTQKQKTWFWINSRLCSIWDHSTGPRVIGVVLWSWSQSWWVGQYLFTWIFLWILEKTMHWVLKSQCIELLGR